MFNEVADRLANEGREDAVGDPSTCLEIDALELERFPARLRLPAGRVYGSYTGALQRLAEATTLRASRPHQGRMLRTCGLGTLTMVRAAVTERDHRLVRFLLLAVTEWLPTARRLAIAHKDQGRGEHCKLCQAKVSETNAHALLACAHTRIRRQGEAYASDANVKRAATLSLNRSQFLSPIHTRPLPAWYDPSGDLVIRVLPHRCTPERLTAYLGHDPLAGALGIPPPGVHALMGLDRDSPGLTGCKTVIAKGAMGVYEARCKSMNTWWHSEDGKRHWSSAIRAQLRLKWTVPPQLRSERRSYPPEPFEGTTLIMRSAHERMDPSPGSYVRRQGVLTLAQW